MQGDNMKHEPVKSSMIESLAHEGTTLQVKFKGGATYECQGVTPEQFHTLKHSASVGKHLNSMKITGRRI